VGAIFDIAEEPYERAQGSDQIVVEGNSVLIRLVARCGSEKEFIERFASFATETEVLVPAPPFVSAGVATQFVIRLNDQSVVMKGRCEVTEVKPVAVAPGAGPAPSVTSLMRIRLGEMEAHTCGVHLRLMERRAASSSPPPNPLGDLDAADLTSFVELAPPETEVVPPKRPARLSRHLDRAKRFARRAAPFAAGVLVPLLLAIVFRPVLTAPTPGGRPSLVASPGAAPSTASAQPRGSQPALQRDCMASVTTTPAGAAVLWGEIALGSSPIERAAIPCGTAIVTLRHERYAEVTRTITSERGRSAVVAERLSRPPAKLMVTSSPPNALIKLNERPVGPAPRVVSTLRFEHLRVEASLPGYQPWKKTLYLKEVESTVDVTLVPASEPNKRAATTKRVPIASTAY